MQQQTDPPPQTVQCRQPPRAYSILLNVQKSRHADTTAGGSDRTLCKEENGPENPPQTDSAPGWRPPKADENCTLIFQNDLKKQLEQ